jgi:hypothetical protein
MLMTHFPEQFALVGHDPAAPEAQHNIAVLKTSYLRLQLVLRPEIVTLEYGDEFPSRPAQRYVVSISKSQRALVFLANIGDAGVVMERDHLWSIVRGSIIDDNHLPVAKSLGQHALYALADVRSMVISRSYDAD